MPEKMPPIEQLRGRPLGRVLIKMGRVTRTQVHEALDLQKQKGGPIGQILVELGHVTETDLQYALAAQVGMRVVNLDDMDINPEIIAALSAQMANTYNVVPVQFDEASKELTIAMASARSARTRICLASPGAARASTWTT